MITTDLSSSLEAYSRLIEQRLDQLVPRQNGPHQHLFEAARYSLLGAGKRLRPILTLVTTEMLGGHIPDALSAACTLEMIHTYSLIHDDLPCMDNDDYRRGKLTVHKKYSEGHAVLTGDYLLTYAFEILATDSTLSAEQKVKLMAILAKRSGGNGMIGGQVMDLAYEGQQIDLAALQALHSRKTGDLMTAAIEFGGILAHAQEAHLHKLQTFGENIGLAFQVIDDILDFTNSQAKHGRAVSSDLINRKSTYVTLLGLDKARACAQEFYDQACKALSTLPFNTASLIELADFILQRHH